MNGLEIFLTVLTTFILVFIILVLGNILLDILKYNKEEKVENKKEIHRTIKESYFKQEPILIKLKNGKNYLGIFEEIDFKIYCLVGKNEIKFSLKEIKKVEKLIF